MGLQAVDAPGLTRTETTKWWTVSAALRGFYDGNYLTANKNVEPVEGSAGIQFTPSVAANFPMDQTYVGASLTYDMRWYEARPDHEVDQSMQFLGKFDHKFSPRYNMNADDMFIYSDEPEVISGGGPTASPIKTDSSVMRNYLNIGFNAVMTERLGLEVGFHNNWYDYLQDPSDIATPTNPDGIGSTGALLDRVEYMPSVNLRYQVREHWVGFVGYQFGYVDYLSSDPIAYDLSTGQDVPGSIRKSQSHYFYVGSDYALSSQLTAAGRVGAQYIDFTDLSDSTSWNPFVDANLAYQYLPGSFLKGGVSYSSFATDLAAPPNNIVTDLNDLTTDQQALVFYGQISHRISARVTGNLIARAQRSDFQNGVYDGENEWFYMLGAGVEYRFSQHVSAELAYNFDRLDSQVQDRSYSRNRGFFGVRATY